MYDHTFSKLANHQSRHQATHKVGCQPGDCIIMATSIFLKGLCRYVWVNMLIYHSRGDPTFRRGTVLVLRYLLSRKCPWYKITSLSTSSTKIQKAWELPCTHSCHCKSGVIVSSACRVDLMMDCTWTANSSLGN